MFSASCWGSGGDVNRGDTTRAGRRGRDGRGSGAGGFGRRPAGGKEAEKRARRHTQPQKEYKFEFEFVFEFEFGFFELQLTIFPQRRWPHARPPRGSPLWYEFMRCRHPTAITHSEKTALRSRFPMCTARALQVVYAHTSGKILSHSAVTRANKRRTRESYRTCLFLIGPTFCCGCPASSAARCRRYTFISVP